MYNILVCDDEKDIVNALDIYLKSEGYSTVLAYNGMEAIEKVREQEIHLVIMDIMMPVMDGITSMVKIREISNIPVILLTAKGEDTEDDWWYYDSFFYEILPLLIVLCIIGVFIDFALLAILFIDIKNATEDIANGNVYIKINTKYLFLDLKVHAENINNISDGIRKAVAEQMRSARFKTELITNVSHDIKRL